MVVDPFPTTALDSAKGFAQFCTILLIFYLHMFYLYIFFIRNLDPPFFLVLCSVVIMLKQPSFDDCCNSTEHMVNCCVSSAGFTVTDITTGLSIGPGLFSRLPQS